MQNAKLTKMYDVQEITREPLSFGGCLRLYMRCLAFRGASVHFCMYIMAVYHHHYSTNTPISNFVAFQILKKRKKSGNSGVSLKITEISEGRNGLV